MSEEKYNFFFTRVIFCRRDYREKNICLYSRVTPPFLLFAICSFLHPTLFPGPDTKLSTHFNTKLIRYFHFHFFDCACMNYPCF